MVFAAKQKWVILLFMSHGGRLAMPGQENSLVRQRKDLSTDLLQKEVMVAPGQVRAPDTFPEYGISHEGNCHAGDIIDQ